MKRKTAIKRLMSAGYSRNEANYLMNTFAKYCPSNQVCEVIFHWMANIRAPFHGYNMFAIGYDSDFNIIGKFEFNAIEQNQGEYDDAELTGVLDWPIQTYDNRTLGVKTINNAEMYDIIVYHEPEERKDGLVADLHVGQELIAYEADEDADSKSIITGLVFSRIPDENEDCYHYGLAYDNCEILLRYMFAFSGAYFGIKYPFEDIMTDKRNPIDFDKVHERRSKNY